MGTYIIYKLHNRSTVENMLIYILYIASIGLKGIASLDRIFFIILNKIRKALFGCRYMPAFCTVVRR